MVKLRLKRGGTKKRPFYHIVAVDVRKKRDGSVIETLGFYNPLSEDEPFRFNENRTIYWHRCGAKATDIVYQLMIKAGITRRIKEGHTGEEVQETPPVEPPKENDSVATPVAEDQPAETPEDATESETKE